MKGYTINFLSHYQHTEEVIYEILACESLKRLVFPAATPRPEPISSITVNLEEEVRELDLINRYPLGEQFNLTLYSESGIEFSLSASYETVLGHNTLVIKFLGDNVNILNVELIETLFSEVIPIFKPFYASAFDRSERTRLSPSERSLYYYDRISRRRYPLEIRWITYFGLEMLEFLKIDRFLNLKTCLKKYELSQGIVVILQEEVFQASNSDHFQRRQQAETELGLLELIESQN